MYGKLKVDLVKENEGVIRLMISEMVLVNGDGEVETAELTEALYREFGRDATKRESATLSEYLEEYVESLEKRNVRSFVKRDVW